MSSWATIPTCIHGQGHVNFCLGENQHGGQTCQFLPEYNPAQIFFNLARKKIPVKF